MKYRIVTNQKTFRIQYKSTLWPKWRWLKEQVALSTRKPVEFTDYVTALEYLAKEESGNQWVECTPIGENKGLKPTKDPAPMPSIRPLRIVRMINDEGHEL